MGGLAEEIRQESLLGWGWEIRYADWDDVWLEGDGLVEPSRQSDSLWLQGVAFLPQKGEIILKCLGVKFRVAGNNLNLPVLERVGLRKLVIKVILSHS